jgi:uncharacterized protein (UPF0210 family)
MEIRSITYFFNPGWPLWPAELKLAGQFIRNARQVFSNAGFVVQSTRLATVPFPTLVPPAKTNQLAQSLIAAAHENGFDYVSLGPALPSVPDSYALIPGLLAAIPEIFVSAVMASAQDGISLPAIQACADIIQRTSVISPDGFANLRFAALANVSAGSPFLPSAYHQGDQPAFGLALESADLAVTAVSTTNNLADMRQAFQNSIESNASILEKAAEGLSKTHRVLFQGLDFSIAPFPEHERSSATAIEGLGVPAAGLPGSLAAAAILTETLDRAHYRRTGFNGLFLPVLEDATLAVRAAEGYLSINDLLLYSAVCGTGLDTIPLPGNTSIGQLSAVLLDVSALALRLNKPLTARLMPIPGKNAGDWTDFSFAYFTNTRIFAIPSVSLHGMLTGNETFALSPRKPSEL